MAEQDSSVSENAESTEEASGPSADEQIADLQQQVQKWKSLSRKNEDKAKATVSELREFEEWKKSQQTEAERAIEDAKASARQEVAAEYGGKIARTAFLAAAQGRVPNPERLLSRMDPTQFLDANGDPDDKAIAEFLDDIAPVAKEDSSTAPAAPGLFQGSQGDRAGSAMPLNGDPLLTKVMGLVGK